jgi:hypothetical protein
LQVQRFAELGPMIFSTEQIRNEVERYN